MKYVQELAHRVGGQQPRDPLYSTATVSVRFTTPELERLEKAARRLKTSRSVIIREALEQAGIL